MDAYNGEAYELLMFRINGGMAQCDDLILDEGNGVDQFRKMSPRVVLLSILSI